jgi:hypothetical protein
LAYWPFSEFIDQEHTMLWSSFEHWWRTAFRTARVLVTPAPQILARSRHACLHLACAHIRHLE